MSTNSRYGVRNLVEYEITPTLVMVKVLESVNFFMGAKSVQI
jgi:hypothetical protein